MSFDSGDSRGSDAERRLDDALRRPIAAPDLTRPIMGRLGYMRVSPAVARRRRMRASAGRLAVCGLALLGLVVAFHLHDRSAVARRPAGLTLPAAIGEGVSRHQERLGRTIRTLRRLAPELERTERPPAVDTLEKDIERSGLGPIC